MGSSQPVSGLREQKESCRDGHAGCQEPSLILRRRFARWLDEQGETLTCAGAGEHTVLPSFTGYSVGAGHLLVIHWQRTRPAAPALASHAAPPLP